MRPSIHLRQFSLFIVLFLAMAVALPDHSAAQGSSNGAGARACNQGGWQHLQQRDDTPFTSQAECVKYVASGGQLFSSDPKCDAVLQWDGYSSLAGRDFSWCYLGPLDLSGVDLSGSDLTGVFMPNTILQNANLSNASLAFAHLPDSVLQGANVSGADLTETNLGIAALSNANFSNARVVKTNFTGAVLLNANFSGAHIANVTWDGTVCPDGSNSNDADRDGSTCRKNL